MFWATIIINDNSNVEFCSPFLEDTWLILDDAFLLILQNFAFILSLYDIY